MLVMDNHLNLYTQMCLDFLPFFRPGFLALRFATPSSIRFLVTSSALNLKIIPDGNQILTKKEISAIFFTRLVAIFD